MLSRSSTRASFTPTSRRPLEMLTALAVTEVPGMAEPRERPNTLTLLGVEAPVFVGFGAPAFAVRLVFLALWTDGWSRNGVSRVSVRELARATGLGRSLVLRSLKGLRGAGLLLAKHSPGQRAEWTVLPPPSPGLGGEPVRVAHRFVTQTGSAQKPHRSPTRTGVVPHTNRHPLAVCKGEPSAPDGATPATQAGRPELCLTRQRRTRARKSSGRAAELVAHYEGEVERTRGIKPMFEFGKAAGVFARLAEAHGAERIRALITEFLEHPPDFFAERNLFLPHHIMSASNELLGRPVRGRGTRGGANVHIRGQSDYRCLDERAEV